MANRAQFLKRWLILTQDKAKFYAQGKVFLSKNMQLELRKYCGAFPPRCSNDSTKCYSKQYIGR